MGSKVCFVHHAQACIAQCCKLLKKFKYTKLFSKVSDECGKFQVLDIHGRFCLVGGRLSI